VAEYLGFPDACLVGMDRPGYGHSSMKRGWKVGDVPADAAALADHLGYDRLIVSGYSGGGPFAIACALKIPQRLSAVGIISGVGPAEIGSAGMHEGNRKKFDLAQRAPWLVKLMIRLAFAGLRGRPDKLVLQMAKNRAKFPPVDQAVLDDQHFLDWMVKETLDAITLSTAGFAHEEILMASPWGFQLSDIRCQNVFLWHGCLDRNVPVSMGQASAKRIPGCSAFFYEDEGHLSLIYHRGREIFRTLIEAGKISR
jgi:pimeloyl-ACP methyl ester carboxylesterase